VGLIDAGKLDRRIRIERAGRVEDDGLGTVEGWSTLQEVSAQYLPQRGSEAREQLGREGKLLASFRIRWWSGVANVGPKDRLRFPAADDGQVWDIQSATEIGRREGIEIIASARAGVTS
jgi:head-tail adaptor